VTDRVFATVGEWAVGADDLQWMLMRHRGGSGGKSAKNPWRPVSFVRSTKDILARCMREKGVDADTASLLLSGLPDTFDQWKATQSSSQSQILPPES
jgi:hypothetical protein